jgi:hypothetical protein
MCFARTGHQFDSGILHLNLLRVFGLILMIMTINSKRRNKSITLKLQYLKLELEEREDELRALEKEFLRELSSLQLESLSLPHKSAPPARVSPPPPDEVIDFSPRQEGPDDVKKLWRNIALVTHPDKTGGDPIKDELYKKAGDSWKGGSYIDLYKIALELGIEPPDTDTTYTILESLSLDLEKKIKEREKSLLWEWGHSSDPAKRQGLMDAYLASMGKKRKNLS